MLIYKNLTLSSTNKFNNHLLPRVPISKSDNLLKFFLKIKTFYEDIKFDN